MAVLQFCRGLNADTLDKGSLIDILTKVPTMMHKLHPSNWKLGSSILGKTRADRGWR